ncbi:hypothetical protein SAMN02910358_02254 [Lachnospiraceae bacterium XBB1006]|nr:hypothetical protein SAMN02910358_02254 [Lachnospiraceae bacterium XBB1006]
METHKYILGIYGLTWDKIAGVDGYEVYRAKNNGSYELHKTTGNIVSLKLEALGFKKGQKYSYKVRAFVKNGKQKVYGKFSKVVTITTK